MGAKKKAKLKPKYTPLRYAWAAAMRCTLRRMVEQCDKGIRNGWLTDDARAMLRMQGVVRMFDRHEEKARRAAERALGR